MNNRNITIHVRLRKVFSFLLSFAASSLGGIEGGFPIIAFMSACGNSLAAQAVPPYTHSDCQVEWVTDGDTIKVNCDGEKINVRFCGIDAPEKDSASGHEQEMGREAHQFLIDRLAKETVDLRAVETDRYGRTIAEVYHQALNVNALMAFKGLAWHYSLYSDNCPSKELIAISERIAQQEEINIWSLQSPTAPWDWRWQQRQNNN